ncbi:thioredoxin fold domain-containing protein [Lentisphaerota bacterium WC36G]|nr:thioredoxin family protein [Lentisphaerae bacterium WC36]
MKKLILTFLLALSSFVLTTFAGSGKEWMTDYDKAVKKATTEGKYLLIDFSGSDWCGWCIKLDNEVFSKKEFKEYAKKNLVLYLADFPRSNTQSPKLRKKNRELSDRFGVRGFPTVILLTPDGKTKVGKTGYRKGGPKKYAEMLDKMIKDYEKKNPKVQPAKWSNNYEEVQKAAMKNKKFMLIEFIQSDSCRYCKQLQKEVFETKEFLTYASTRFELLTVDFPFYKKLNEKLKKQNRMLANKYTIAKYPTIVLVTPDGKNVVVRLGYEEGGVKEYLAKINDAIKYYMNDKDSNKDNLNVKADPNMKSANKIGGKNSPKKQQD